ncbi:sterile alpha motif domain-containing protein 1-like [Pogoniulus pusillus]|uniref:sterile alpha motif domain-containing protein 1-like n=1 Tax=Pogoniulus pusillus TaxID=488313 RepID=UPI0030B91ED8
MFDFRKETGVLFLARGRSLALQPCFPSACPAPRAFLSQLGHRNSSRRFNRPGPVRVPRPQHPRLPPQPLQAPLPAPCCRHLSAFYFTPARAPPPPPRAPRPPPPGPGQPARGGGGGGGARLCATPGERVRARQRAREGGREPRPRAAAEEKQRRQARRSDAEALVYQRSFSVVHRETARRRRRKGGGRGSRALRALLQASGELIGRSSRPFPPNTPAAFPPRRNYRPFATSVPGL